ncbi:MAG: hypothetical protein F6K59_35230 [Moorea sp. SIO3F7]|nr:hypothetical protein [Moorena sp. SIO3E8]NEQ03898.1 hypothetical protein [Moorena sp. SIO3F7]
MGSAIYSSLDQVIEVSIQPSVISEQRLGLRARVRVQLMGVTASKPVPR